MTAVRIRSTSLSCVLRDVEGLGGVFKLKEKLKS